MSASTNPQTAVAASSELLANATQKEKYDYWQNWVNDQIEGAGGNPESAFFTNQEFTEEDRPYTVDESGVMYSKKTGERVYLYQGSQESINGTQDDPSRMDNYGDYGYYAGERTGKVGIGDLYLTESQIKEKWDSDEMNTFKAAHPDMNWDTYWSYITERQGLIESGVLGPGGRPTDGEFWSEEGAWLGNDAYSDDLNNEAYQALLDKYGIQGKHYDEDGNGYVWNGSGYTKVYDVPKADFRDYTKMAAAAGLAAVSGTALANALGGIAGPALPAGVAGPAAPLLSPAVSAGLGAGAGSAIGQLATTGSVDPKSVLASAVVGGLNPGGMLAENFGQATNTGVNIVPDNVVGGFLQGAGNSTVSQLITDGSVDLQSALLAGGLGAGTKAITDLFDDTDQFSVESEMRRIELEREMQGLPPLSTADLYAEAMFGNMTGKTDLAGLIGKDGLLSFIPEMSTGWLSKLTGGGSLDPTAVFIGPDGKQYTDLQVIEQGLDPAAIYFGEVDGWSSATISYENTPLGDLADWGVNNIPGVKPVVNQVGNFLDALAEQEFKDKYGFTPSEYLAGAADSADYAKRLDELQRILVYGPLDETYNWAENPRGTSQYVGLLTGLYDQYSTGSLNDQREFQEPYYIGPDGTKYSKQEVLGMGINPADVIAGNVKDWSYAYGGIQDALNITGLQEVAATAPDPNSGSVAIVNLGGGETVVDPNATLPGSNITIIDAITQGIIDGILVDTSGSTTGGNTTDVNVNETTVNADSSLADTSSLDNTVVTNDALTGPEVDTITNRTYGSATGDDLPVNTNDDLADNENAISTDDNLADNENAVSTGDELASGGGDDLGDGIFSPANGNGLPPLWSELFGYSRISPYEGARLKILNNAIAGLTGVGMMSPKLIKEPYMKLNRDLLDAGILS